MKKITLLIIILSVSLVTNKTISQTRHYVKAAATGTGDGSSWANASGDLQAMIDAIQFANEEIWIAKGTYLPTKTVGYTAAHVALTDPRFKSFHFTISVTLYGGFAGNEATLSQRKAMNKTILSGDFNGNDIGLTNNGENAYHVIFAQQAAPTLDMITVSGGNTTGMPVAYSNQDPYPQFTPDGGAIYAYKSTVIGKNCVFINNNSSRYGGVIYAFDNGGDYFNCLFLNNHASNGSVCYIKDFEVIDHCRFSNCTMFNNSSNGAVCKATSYFDTYLYNCIIWGNTINGLSADSFHVVNSITQNAFLPNNLSETGTVDADPMFTNAADVDGADNILGTNDDGLIPQCGPTIDRGGTFGVSFLPKDFRGATRIQSSMPDMGAYETPLISAIESIGIQTITNHNNFTEDLPRGLCSTKPATFQASTQGNGGTFQWKQNGVNVGTNSYQYTSTNYKKNDQISLSYTNVAGCTPPTVIQSNVITLTEVSAAPTVITFADGPANACPYINVGPAFYHINKDTNALVTHWYLNYLNGTTPILGGPADSIASLTFSPGFVSVKLNVLRMNFCGISSTKVIPVYTNKLPATPGSISGPTDPCPYMQSAANPSGLPATYTIRKVIDASSYTWTVPANATITSHPGGTGANDTIITVIFNSSFTTGSLSVQAINYCGSKSPRTITLTKKASGTPGTITGPTAVCPFQQIPPHPAGTPVDYTIRKVNYATSYTWTLPSGATATHPGGTGINDTIIRVTYGSSFAGGVITVKSNTNCSTSSARSLSIIYKLPYTPGTITATAATACPQRRITYSLASLPSYATSVQWTVPASGTLISGQGALSIIVEFAGPTSVTDTVRVVAVNDCGTSAQKKLKVAALTGSCRSAGKSNEQNIPPAITRSTSPVINNLAEPNVTVMPNPSQHYFNLVATGYDPKISIRMQVTDAAGRAIETKQNILNGETIQVGQNYKPGIYFAIFVQGTKKKTIRLVKL
ncbi:MAG: T9SS type A sorting domain-containing protein [Ferruginibacter sp.]